MNLRDVALVEWLKNPHQSDLDRFWGYVDKETYSPCWRWTRAKTDKGYGLFSFSGIDIRAHRFSWALQYGIIPEGWELDHIEAFCRFKDCCNPEHLRLLRPAENARLGALKSPAHNAYKLFCTKGHLFTPENTYIKVRGSGRKERVCLICKAEQARGRVARRRGEAQDRLVDI